MRFLVLATAIGAAVVAAVTPAPAQAQRWGGYNGREVRQERRECRSELNHARSRGEYRREARECRREISRARAGYRDGWRGDRRWNDRRWNDRRHWNDRRRWNDHRGGYYRGW